MHSYNIPSQSHSSSSWCTRRVRRVSSVCVHPLYVLQPFLLVLFYFLYCVQSYYLCLHISNCICLFHSQIYFPVSSYSATPILNIIWAMYSPHYFLVLCTFFRRLSSMIVFDILQTDSRSVQICSGFRLSSEPILRRSHSASCTCKQAEYCYLRAIFLEPH